MTPKALAAIHAAAFVVPRPWSADEIADLLADRSVFVLTAPQAFLIGRVVAGESELLTVAVLPVAQGAGVGAALVSRFLAEAKTRGATEAFLEVAEDNAPARALYARAGFSVVGQRRGYFRTPDGQYIDALVMRRGLAVASA